MAAQSYSLEQKKFMSKNYKPTQAKSLRHLSSFMTARMYPRTWTLIYKTNTAGIKCCYKHYVGKAIMDPSASAPCFAPGAMPMALDMNVAGYKVSCMTCGFIYVQKRQLPAKLPQKSVKLRQKTSNCRKSRKVIQSKFLV